MNKQSDFDEVQKIIQELWEDGLIQRGRGYCYSMADIIHKLLFHHGIDSYLQECQLMVVKKDVIDLLLVGYSMADGIIDPVAQIKTHVICITKTKEPILIDLSVYGMVDDVPYICEKIDKDAKNLTSKFTFPGGNFIYSKKTTDYQLPQLHERSIIHRIETDNKIFLNIKYIKIFLCVLFVISSVNLTRGFVDFYLTFIHTHPSKIIKLIY
jgi:hypothetical protein